AGESPFQDGQAPSVISTTNGGVIAQAVKDVTASGALYFSSAGNSNNLDSGTSGTWEGDFIDGGSGLHHFRRGQISDVLLQPGFGTELFWSDPLGGSVNDYDLYVFDSTLTTVLARSINFQTGTQDPYESVAPTPAGSRIVVKKFAGSSRFLHL